MTNSKKPRVFTAYRYRTFDQISNEKVWSNWLVKEGATQKMEFEEQLHLLEATPVIAELKRLREALKYYGDHMNYSVDYETSQQGFSRRCVLYGDIEERNEATGLAGLRARKALADSEWVEELAKDTEKR